MFALCSWEQHVGQHFEEKCCWQAFGPLGILSEQFFHWDWCGCLLTTLPFLSLPVYSCISSQPAPLILVHCHSQNDKPMVSLSQTILLWSSWVESHNFSPFHLEKKKLFTLLSTRDAAALCAGDGMELKQPTLEFCDFSRCFLHHTLTNVFFSGCSLAGAAAYDFN